MSAVRIFTPENHLGTVIGGPTDPSMAELVQSATKRVGLLAPQVKLYVAEQIAIVAGVIGQPEEIIFGESKRLAGAVLGICETAAAAGLGPLGEAARATLMMLDALFDCGVWHTEALLAHTDAVLLVAANEQLSAAQCEEILTRLKELRGGIGIVE
jgi:hypothetical protein